MKPTAMEVVSANLGQILGSIAAMERDSKRTQHTDTDQAWQCLYGIRKLAREAVRAVNKPATPAPVLVLVHGGVAEEVGGPAVDIRVIDQDNIEAGDPPTELPKGAGFEELIAQCSGLEEGEDYVWVKS